MRPFRAPTPPRPPSCSGVLPSSRVSNVGAAPSLPTGEKHEKKRPADESRDRADGRFPSESSIEQARCAVAEAERRASDDERRGDEDAVIAPTSKHGAPKDVGDEQADESDHPA